MSRRLWPEAASVWLAPSQVGLALRARGWRARTAPPRVAQSQGSADTLRALARLGLEARADDARARVVLSNRFVRLAVLPHGQALRGAAERQLAAREVLRAMHGDAVDGWTVSVDGSACASPLAAAVDSDWLDKLQATARQLGLQTVSVRPLWTLAAAQVWPQLAGREAWLLVTEADGAMLARIDARGHWLSLRGTHEGPAGWADWLARCSLLEGLAPASLPLVHADWRWSPETPDVAPLAGSGWDVRCVRLGPDTVWA